jgi:hypothetical protein
MCRIFALLIVSLIFYAAAAQPISLTGKILGKNNKVVTGAIVTLAVQKMKDTTDNQGAFSLRKGTFVADPAKLPSADKISMINGIVTVSLAKAEPVAIELFDLKGNLLATTLDRPASAGDYRFDISSHRLAADIKLVRVTAGRNSSIFRHVWMRKAMHRILSARASSSPATGWLAKTAVTVDTLKISASGYKSKDTTISSYQGTVNVILDTLALAKFSFFVTSLEGLQRLSGGQNGFGGDFRFGKTGDGAGLLGADSICQCLAEYSMPGAKVKGWRAFLSATRDAGGMQVNAIDRIGAGPWYDRLGRLVSKTKSDLLNDRPNADSAIKNDLPNEYGVPNHRPDPNKANVDNHQFVTGSTAKGVLFSSSKVSGLEATCQDWTSKEAKGGKPYCGLSWPKTGMKKETGFNPEGMSMSNWISVWELWGCEPGLDLTEASLKGKAGVYTIGNGGGYGGFYCFALTP